MAMTGIKSFTLRGGRMSAAQEKAYKELSPHYCIPFSAACVDFEAVFGNKNPVVIEIGFGMGSATARIAAEHPETNYLGIEVFKAGVGKMLWEIERGALKNIRIIEHDAAEVIAAMVPEQSAAGFHVFFPDPWPKKRHHKRRLIQRPFTDRLAARLKTGGYIYAVTDWPDYAAAARAALSATPLLANVYGEYAPRLPWRPHTKFEKKAQAAGRAIYELYFVREG
ncbi:MAG: tRNA (guanosine(46)-N7)-methyltransferase TrmB [Spirochaetaceae bacterium]|jgi:tRNA (guanine-N7-)-methyltransferase|nr:tRNA (guanosine(46)-N7)-methyltransferase TrmB [Spirochaetaceae bacterium]